MSQIRARTLRETQEIFRNMATNLQSKTIEIVCLPPEPSIESDLEDINEDDLGEVDPTDVTGELEVHCESEEELEKEPEGRKRKRSTKGTIKQKPEVNWNSGQESFVKIGPGDQCKSSRLSIQRPDLINKTPFELFKLFYGEELSMHIIRVSEKFWMWMQWFGTCVRNHREVRDQKTWFKQIKKMSIEVQFEEMENQQSWYKLFQILKTKSAKQTFDLTTHEAKKGDNRVRNRFRDVLPYDQTRATFRPCQNKSSDYINASLVTVPSASRSYICAQGPLPQTVGHFWEMIWAHNCVVIVMLNSLIEKGMPTCAIYWPSEVNSEMVLDDSDLCHEICVTLTKETINPVFVIREFALKRRTKGNDEMESTERKISHFHFTNWPDFGVPECPNAFMNFLMTVRQSGCFEIPVGKESGNPVVVHCTAGIGRTGAFVLVDVCLTLLSLYRVVDIPTQLLELRTMRVGFVQTPEQLRFCYQAIILGKKSLSVQSPTVSPVTKHRPSSLSLKPDSPEGLSPSSSETNLVSSPKSPRRELLRQDGRTPSLDAIELGQKRQRTENLNSLNVETKAADLGESESVNLPTWLPGLPPSNVADCDSANLIDQEKRDAEIRRQRQARNEKLREKIESIKRHQKQAEEGESPWKAWLLPSAAVAIGILSIWIAWNKLG